MEEDRRLAFGGIAELYDRARPSYPPALIDDVLGFAELQPGDEAIEVGAGTGKATVLFAERGLSIAAIEPSGEMAQVARRNTAGFPGVTVTEVEFERWAPERRVKLLYSAQAWHWIDPRVRFTRAGQALAQHGVLAAFWNRFDWRSSPIHGELEEVYSRLAPELAGQVPPGPLSPSAPDDSLRDWQGGPEQETGFTAPEWHAYPWLCRYTTDEYVSLLRTHSDHIVLAGDRLEALLDAVRGVIDQAGGMLELEYVTRLGLARPTA